MGDAYLRFNLAPINKQAETIVSNPSEIRGQFWLNLRE